MAHVLNSFEKGELIDHYRSFIQLLPEFVDFSRDMASDHAESYREFEVGNLGVAVLPGVKGLKTFSGANFKIKHLDDEVDAPSDDSDTDLHDLHDEHDIPRDVPKVCAEMATINAVDSEELFFIGHVTTATTKVEEIEAITGVPTATLPPCSECVPVLDNSPNTSAATLYVSAGLDEDVCQVRNMRLLKQLYHTGQERRLTLGRVGRIATNGDLSQETTRSLARYDQMIRGHIFNNAPHSRAISSFARSAITATVVRR